MSLKDKMAEKMKAAASGKFNKVTEPIKGTLDKGKAVQQKVDSTVEYSTIEFIACWAAVTLYDAFTSPLNSICMFITSVAALRDKQRLRTLCSIINGTILVLFLVICFSRRYVLGISYPLAALTAWLLIILQSQKTANSEVDDCILECMSMCNAPGEIPGSDRFNTTPTEGVVQQTQQTQQTQHAAATAVDEQLDIVLQDDTVL